MTNTDHVALTLPSASVTSLSGGAAGDESNISRKSLRRVSLASIPLQIATN